MIHPSKTLAFLVTFLCLNAVTVQAQPKSQITLTIDGFKNKNGQACVTLFASNKGFPSSETDAIQSRCMSITKVPLVITFNNLAPGNYAVAVLHDANNDNTANRNKLGIPIEGFGFSKNPVIRTRPPQFNDAAVGVTGSNTNINIKLQYIFGG